MIKTNDVCKVVETSEGALVILEGITLEINQGESVAIVGASGSGKTTLLSLLAGLDSPSEGAIVLGGDQDITMMSEAQRAKLRGDMVGFVFQTFQLLSSLTALENVMLPLELSGIKDAAKLAKEILSQVGLAERLKHFPKVLSGGEQQRVALARAFVVQPQLLLADEPTGSLDAQTGESIMDLMLSMNHARGTTLILVTHDQKLAARCDRTLTLQAGQLISKG